MDSIAINCDFELFSVDSPEELDFDSLFPVDSPEELDFDSLFPELKIDCEELNGQTSDNEVINHLTGNVTTNNKKRTRSCSNCSTSYTPLWRKNGEELLCNACGNFLFNIFYLISNYS